MAKEDRIATGASDYSFDLPQCYFLWVTDQGALGSTASGGVTQLSQPSQAPNSISTSTKSHHNSPHISNMPHEILLKIQQSLHPTAVVCLSLTCRSLHNFFGQPATPLPGLMTAVIPPAFAVTSAPTILFEKYLWELLEAHMKPRLWAGYYGVERFVQPNRYREIRNQYWALNPQRPYLVQEASPFMRPGGEAVDVEEEIAKMMDSFLQEAAIVRSEESRKTASWGCQIFSILQRALKVSWAMTIQWALRRWNRPSPG